MHPCHERIGAAARPFPYRPASLGYVCRNPHPQTFKHLPRAHPKNTTYVNTVILLHHFYGFGSCEPDLRGYSFRIFNESRILFVLR